MVGDALLDVVARPVAPLRVGSDTASVNQIGGGGSAANTAAWLGALGADVELVAATGDDPLGAQLRAELAAVGVAPVGPVITGGRTGTCVVLVGADGERTMLPDRAASAELRPSHVEAALGRPGSLAAVHLSGYTLLDPAGRDTARAALARGRAAGALVSIDAASSGPITDAGAAEVLADLAGADLVLANDDEVEALRGEAAVRAVVPVLVRKSGASGASWLSADDEVRIEAPPVSVVDTTGAGDALAAGLLAALVAGEPPERALRAGVDLAARAVGSAGGRPSVR